MSHKILSHFFYGLLTLFILCVMVVSCIIITYPSEQGRQGIPGLVGDTGDTGAKGDKGDTGKQGPKGDPAKEQHSLKALPIPGHS